MTASRQEQDAHLELERGQEVIVLLLVLFLKLRLLFFLSTPSVCECVGALRMCVWAARFTPQYVCGGSIQYKYVCGGGTIHTKACEGE